MKKLKKNIEASIKEYKKGDYFTFEELEEKYGFEE